MKIQKMKIPAILGALLLAGTLSAGAQMNSDSLYKERIVLSIISVRRRDGLVILGIHVLSG